MAWACWSIVLACLGLQLASRLAPCSLPTDMAFSGDALERGSTWVWISASMLHGSWSHLINNMLHMSAVAPQLEDRGAGHASERGGDEG